MHASQETERESSAERDDTEHARTERERTDNRFAAAVGVQITCQSSPPSWKAHSWIAFLLSRRDAAAARCAAQLTSRSVGAIPSSSGFAAVTSVTYYWTGWTLLLQSACNVISTGGGERRKRDVRIMQARAHRVTGVILARDAA